MNLYKTTGQFAAATSDAKQKVLWSGAQSDASKDRVQLKKDGFKGVETEAVDVPTNKVDLLAWLNTEMA